MRASQPSPRAPSPDEASVHALAVAEIYRRHRGFVRRVLRRLGVEARTLDDLTQEVFVVVHRRLPEFEGRATVRTWLFAIAARVARDHRAKLARRKTDETEPAWLANHLETEDLVARFEAADLLERCLGELDDDKWTVFVLAEVLGMTAPEIAELRGLPLNTVYSRLRRARRVFARVERRHRRPALALLPGAWFGPERGSIWAWAGPATAKVSVRVMATIAFVLVAVIALVIGTSSERGTTEDNPDASATKIVEGRQAREAERPSAGSPRHREQAKAARAELGPNPAHEPLPALAEPDPSPHGALEGRVINWSTRRGVPGAELSFLHEGTIHTTRAGPSGEFRFEAPREGMWSLATVTADAFLPYAPEPGRAGVLFVARPRQRVTRADLFLFPALTYEGLVVDTAGEPLANAEVELFGADAGEQALVGIASTFTSDAQGRFEFHAPDDALLEARHPDHPPGRARVDGSVQLSHRLTIEMGSAPTTTEASIEGRLVDAEGVGLARVEIRASPLANDRGPRGVVRDHRSVTGAEGSFSLGPLDESAYRVTATLVGRPLVSQSPVEPGAEIELRSPAGLDLVGRLVDAEGGVVAAANVTLVQVTGPLARTPIATLARFDASGAFTFEDLEPGRYELLAIAQGYARSEPVPVEVGTEGPTPVVELVLGPGARIFGQVVDAESEEPLEFALISATGVDGADSILPGLSTTVSDDQGRFELVGVDPGRMSLTIHAFAHDGRVLTGIELESGDRHGPVRVELSPVGEDRRPKTEVTGIGVAIGPSEAAIAVQKVIEGGGAAAAGIVEGETILGVDGRSVASLGFESAVESIRGPAGTTVTLELRRLDGSLVELVVERRLIVAP